MAILKNLYRDIVLGKDPIRQKDAYIVFLGILGLVFLAHAYPFGWEMPNYAAY